MFSSGRALCASYLLALVTVAFSLPSSFPHVYPGQPAGDYSPSWQSYFQVTQKLPNVNFDIGRSFAGNLPVQRAGHPNNTLFFWGFEKKVGSLTNAASNNKDPWAIWLNGGPGSSSMHGLFFENGPIHIKPDYSLEGNQYSWNKLVDYFWIDQPVGVGFATADADGYVNNEDMVGEDFLGFLTNLVKVFPGLKNRPLILTGESYAGVYIPNILKAYFNTPNPPVTISKIAIGDGSYTNEQTFEQAPATTIVETYPQIVGYDKDVFKYLEKMSSLCQYDVKLTYPQQGGIIPAIPLNLPTGRDIPWKFRNQLSYRKFFQALQARQLERRDVRIRGRQVNTVDKSQFWVGRSNDTLDPWYGCLVLDLALDYAVNYTLPYNIDGGFNVYDITDATSPSIKQDASRFMNDATVRAALHAPTSKNWTVSFRYVFGETSPEGAIQERSPEPMNWFSEMATNATAKNIGVILFSGNNDALIPHWGTEIAIQNTTFGGIQGFTVKPSTPWYSNGKFAGIIRQERGWTYALFDKAGHMVPLDQPATAYTFLKQFVLGNDQTGLVIKTPSGAVKVVGGTDPKLAEDILPGEDAIWYGQGTKASSYIYPKATRTAWSAFIKTETASPKPTSTRRP